MSDDMDRPLGGVFTLDLSSGVAGSFAAKVLADYGADVVKVEPPTGGEERRLGPFPTAAAHPEHSGMFLYLNANKRGITVDVSADQGRAVLDDLVDAAQVVVLGDRAEDVRLLLGQCPRLNAAADEGRVVTAVTSYGLDGPYRDRQAEEINLFGFGGPMLATGVPEREPMMYPEYVALLQAGLAAALATLVAHFGQQMFGRGSLVDFAIAETLLGSWDRRAYSLQAYQYWGEIPTARMHSHAMAFGTYPCKDGMVTLAAQGSRFPKLLTLIGRQDLLDDERFRGFSATFDPANFDAFNEILLGWLSEHTRDEVFLRGQEHGVLVAPVLTPEECLADRHLQERGFWQSLDDRGLNYVLPGRAVRLADDDPPALRPAPLLSQHTEDVLLGRLGYSDRLLADLREAEIV